MVDRVNFWNHIFPPKEKVVFTYFFHISQKHIDFLLYFSELDIQKYITGQEMHKHFLKMNIWRAVKIHAAKIGKTSGF